MSQIFLRFLVVALLAAACDAPSSLSEQDDPANVVATEALTSAGAALLVVGSTTLGAGDAALQSRLQSLGFTVTVRGATTVTASDAARKVVLISESVTSSDVNTRLRDVATPVISFEPGLFDDLGFVENVSTNFGTIASQTSIALLGNAAAPTGDVSVSVTSSAQTLAWGRPVASANRIATVAGDATRATIFSFDRGAALSGLTAPARRAGWFATSGVPVAFTANGWSLFDALIRWAQAGVTIACGSTAGCPTGQSCINGTCSTVACGSTAGCPTGQSCINGTCSTVACGSTAGCPTGQSCINGTCSTTCAAGSFLCGTICCSSTNTCRSGACI